MAWCEAWTVALSEAWSVPSATGVYVGLTRIALKLIIIIMVVSIARYFIDKGEHTALYKTYKNV